VRNQPTTTYGDVLQEHARKARHCEDSWSEAIDELAICWLESGQWHRTCVNPNAVQAAIRNKMRDMRRTNYRHHHVEEEVENLDVPSHEHRIVASSCLLKLVKVLDDDHLQVLFLDANGCSGPELAAELGITSGNARLRLYRARAARDALPGLSEMDPVA
jgi:DNA-directed RNA polymerase specialized sigma24 family protein